MDYVVKAALKVSLARELALAAQKTMYGGKGITKGDTIFVFASENEGGRGLAARGTVVSARLLPRKPGVARQTPRVDLRIACAASATRPLGRKELKGFTAWKDGRPETELNFKLYRQATNKVAGISETTAAFLRTFF